MARTTLTIDDRLLERVKQSAARQHETLSRALNAILSEHFQPRKREKAYHLKWVTVEGKMLPSADPADRDRLYDFLDERK